MLNRAIQKHANSNLGGFMPPLLDDGFDDAGDMWIRDTVHHPQRRLSPSMSAEHIF